MVPNENYLNNSIKSFRELNNKRSRGVFLLFLVLVCLVWALSRMDQQYVSEVEVYPEYYNFPRSAVFDKVPPHSLKLTVKAKGSQLLLMQMGHRTFAVDVSAVARQRGKECLWIPSEHTAMIEQRLNFAAKIQQVVTDTLWFGNSAADFKRVRVLADAWGAGFREGFTNFTPWKSDPEYVEIYGDRKLLRRIKELRLPGAYFTELDRDVKKTVRLNLAGEYASLTINPDTVSVSLTVSEYTQGEISVPIKAINVPWEYHVRLFDEKVTVRYITALEDYHSIREKDFQIVADFRNIGTQRQAVYLEIRKQSPKIFNPILSDNKVEFLFRQKYK